MEDKPPQTKMEFGASLLNEVYELVWSRIQAYQKNGGEMAMAVGANTGAIVAVVLSRRGALTKDELLQAIQQHWESPAYSPDKTVIEVH